jgi:mono/diheme cytochrome c family protein
MLRSLWSSALGLLAALAAPLHAAPDPAAIQRFVTTYCIECHGPDAAARTERAKSPRSLNWVFMRFPLKN